MFSIPTEMIEIYLKRRLVDAEILRQSIAQNTEAEFHRIGHQLKGNAKSFGFPELEILAQRMELITPHELQDKGLSLLEEYQAWIQASMTLSSAPK